MNRIVLGERKCMPNGTVLTMWNAENAIQNLGFINPVIQQTNERLWKMNKHKRIELMSDMKKFCTCSPQNIDSENVHTRHNSRKLWTRFKSIFIVYAQEKQKLNNPANVEKNAEGKTNVECMVDDQEVQKFIAQQTGMDRIRLLFGGFDELYGEKEHPQFYLYKRHAAFVAMFTFPFIAYGASQRASDRFKTRAVALKYETEFLSRRAHMDAMVFSGGKSGLRWAVKIGITVALMMGISELIATYRNKTGIIEVMTGAGLGFGLVQLATGPKAFVGGTVLGAIVGFFPAVVMLIMKKQTNTTQQEEHFLFMRSLLERKRKLELQAIEEKYVSVSENSQQDEPDG